MAKKEEVKKEASVPAPIDPQSDALVALGVDAGGDGLDEMGADEFIVPRTKIVQPTSREGTPGTFRINLTGEEYKELEVIGVKVERGRTFWVEGNMDEPACRSYDFFYPDPAIENPVSPQCASHDKETRKAEDICPKAKWGADGRPPECGQTMNLLCIEKDSGLPFWLQIHGKSIAPFRRFISSIKLKNHRLFQYSVKFTLKEIIDKKGKYYVLQFTPPEKLTPEELQVFAPQILQLKSLSFQRTNEEDSASPESEARSATPEWVK